MPASLNSETVSSVGFMLGTLLAGIWFGVRGWKRPPQPQEPMLAVRGAIVDNDAIAPLIAEIRRLNENLEKEIDLRSHAVEESRKREDQKAMALAIADSVREDILEEMRREIQKAEPAPMPSARRRDPKT